MTQSFLTRTHHFTTAKRVSHQHPSTVYLELFHLLGLYIYIHSHLRRLCACLSAICRAEHPSQCSAEHAMLRQIQLRKYSTVSPFATNGDFFQLLTYPAHIPMHSKNIPKGCFAGKC